MGFLSKEDTCDHCGKSLEDVDDPVTDGNHEFCSAEHKQAYAEEHDHEDDEEEEAICEFC